MKAGSGILTLFPKLRGSFRSLLALLFLFLAATPASAGPLWWKISNGAGSTLWILGIPDGMPMNTDWDDAALRRRLAAAKQLISPLLGAPVTEPDDCWVPGEWVRADTLRSAPISGTMVLGAGVAAKPSASPDQCKPGSAHGKAQESYGAAGAFSYAVSTSPGEVLNQNRLTNFLWRRTLGRGEADGSHILFGNTVYPVPEGPARTFKDPLRNRLSPNMMARVNAVMPRLLGEIPNALQNGKTWEIALWLDLWNWPSGKLLGNPVTTRAQSMARNAHLPIDIIYVPALWKPMLLDPAPYPPDKTQWADFDWLWETRPSLIEPPEVLQQKCLAQVLDQAESKAMPAARLEAVAAWARGDLEHALKRSNGIQLCLMGDLPSASAQDFEVRQAQIYIERLDPAFLTKGQTVALVELDPLLLLAGGVLDHYRRLGFEISTGDGLE